MASFSPQSPNNNRIEIYNYFNLHFIKKLVLERWKCRHLCDTHTANSIQNIKNKTKTSPTAVSIGVITIFICSSAYKFLESCCTCRWFVYILWTSTLPFVHNNEWLCKKGFLELLEWSDIHVENDKTHSICMNIWIETWKSTD